MAASQEKPCRVCTDFHKWTSVQVGLRGLYIRPATTAGVLHSTKWLSPFPEAATESPSDRLPCGQGAVGKGYVDVPAYSGGLFPRQTDSKGPTRNEGLSGARFPVLPLQ